MNCDICKWKDCEPHQEPCCFCSGMENYFELAEPYASAPELLEALEKMLLRWGDYRHWIMNDHTPGYQEQAKEYEEAARAAIAKAKGQLRRR